MITKDLLIPYITPFMGAYSYIGFTEDEIQVWNLNTYITLHFSMPEFNGMVFRGQDFITALKRFPIDSFHKTEGEIVASNGKSKLILSPVNEKMPEFEPIASSIPLPSNFNAGIEACIISSNRSPYSGVYINDTAMIGTDGKEIIVYTLDTCMDAFWISDKGASILKNYVYDRYSLTPEYFIGINNDYTIRVHRLRDAVYPKNKSLAFFDNIGQCRCFPKGITEAIKEASVMGTEDGNCKIFLSGTYDKMTIVGGKRTGRYTIELDWDGGFDFTFVGLYKHLKDVTEDSTFTITNNKMIISNNPVMTLILGMREG